MEMLYQCVTMVHDNDYAGKTLTNGEAADIAWTCIGYGIDYMMVQAQNMMA